jgi:hypothetical protein
MPTMEPDCHENVTMTEEIFTKKDLTYTSQTFLKGKMDTNGHA